MARPPRVSIADDLVLHEHLVARSRRCDRGSVSHIWPGPSRGYRNSLISVLIVVDRLLSDAAVEDRPRERQALDALRGPFGADLGARDAPHLLRVGLEEDLEQPLAEAVGDPLLEVLLDRIGAERHLTIAGQDHAPR